MYDYLASESYRHVDVVSLSTTPDWTAVIIWNYNLLSVSGFIGDLDTVFQFEEVVRTTP